MRQVIVIAVAAVFAAGSAPAQAQSWRPPTDAQRCPSKWGAGDERGAGNHMKPETVLRAARLIRTGQVVELGQVLSGSMPLTGTRRFEMHTKRTNMNPESNRRGSNEEIVISEIGQVGTQFDGFSHQTIGDSMYNCFKVDDTATRTGFSRLGVQQVGALMTRGVLIDVAGLKGVDMLPDTYEITVDRLAAGAAAAEPHASGRRRLDRPHRLGPAVGQGQCPLPANQSRPWRRRGRVARPAGPDARRRRQLGR